MSIMVVTCKKESELLVIVRENLGEFNCYLWSPGEIPSKTGFFINVGQNQKKENTVYISNWSEKQDSLSKVLTILSIYFVAWSLMKNVCTFWWNYTGFFAKWCESFYLRQYRFLSSPQVALEEIFRNAAQSFSLRHLWTAASTCTTTVSSWRQ